MMLTVSITTSTTLKKRLDTFETKTSNPERNTKNIEH